MTESSGLGFAGFCHGIIVGDIDNDGDQDVFLCNYGPNVLYLNNGDGTFRDISKSAGIDRAELVVGRAPSSTTTTTATWTSTSPTTASGRSPRTTSSAATPRRRSGSTARPRTIRTAKHILYRNNGDLTFTDVTDAAGVGRADGHGFGVVAADLNGDGLIDLYVANDMNPNFLFLNKGDGTFEDATEISGAAFDEKGRRSRAWGSTPRTSTATAGPTCS